MLNVLKLPTSSHLSFPSVCVSNGRKAGKAAAAVSYIFNLERRRNENIEKGS
jgi:hypothetical protein